MKTTVSTFKQKKRENRSKDRKWIFRIFDRLEIVGSLDSFESFVSRNRIDFQGFLSFEYIYIYIFEGIPNFIVKR